LSLLEVERLSAFHGDFQALFDVSLAIEEGECVAIIGANGAGKSTLLGAVAGLVRSQGAIRFAGTSLSDRPAGQRVRLGLSLVPEGRRVFPSLSVEDNLKVGAYARNRGPWTLDRVYELFPMLADRARVSAAVLSGGEQQALAIGRALLANPRLLLLDEISLGLAPVVVQRLYQAMPRIREAGATVVLVEQDVEQALGASDRVYCLLEGRLSLQGRAGEMTRERIVAAYFGL
jgi:branched-chain amino acid transport system ATP-binding protein